MKVIIGFSRTKKGGIAGLFSRVITRFEGVPFSHVYVRWYSETADRGLVYQASGTKVNFVGLDRFMGHSQVFEEYEFTMAGEKKPDLLRFCIDVAGEDYGISQAFGIGLMRLAKWWFGKRISNPFRHGEICSEIGAKVLRIMGYSPDFDDDQAGPREVWEYVKSLPEAIKLENQT